MANFYGAYLQIPQIGGRIDLNPNISEFHIGRDDIKNSATVPIDNPSSYNVISGKRSDSQGNIVKEQFIITLKNQGYIIEDKRSSNGTYCNGHNLRDNPLELKDGDEIIVPIDNNGQLMQLKMYFKYAQKPISNNIISSTNASSALKNPKIISSSQFSNIDGNDEAQYYEPPTYSNFGNQPKISNQKRGNAVYINPDTEDNTTGSFILIQEQVSIPSNAFTPNSGLDLDWVYKLEKSEKWHIAYAFTLLFLMVYHTYINLQILQLIFSSTPFDPIVFFVDPIAISAIFGLSFIVHELSHLNMGKKCGYQSRFCLTEVGVKSTKKSMYIGIPFGLPGAAVSVGIDPDKDKNNIGKIKFAGPLSNLIFAIILFIVAIALPETSIIAFKFKSYLAQGASLNCVLGAFNLLPLKVKGFALDGENIIKWNKKYYVILFMLFIIGIMIAIFYSQEIYKAQWMFENNL